MSKSTNGFSGSSKSSSPCDQRSMPEGSLGGLLALTLSLDQTNGDKSGDTCRQSTEHSSNGDSSGDTCRLATGHFPSRTPSSGRCNATEFLTRRVSPLPRLGVQYRKLILPVGQEYKQPFNNTMGAAWEENCIRQALCRLKSTSGMMVFDQATADILTGHLRLEDIPSVTHRVVRVYVCSTGADSKAERSAFVSTVYPKLREYCRNQYGLQFQVVDLMWGLTNDRLQADRDLMAMKVREIFRCQAMSLGPSFVAFIGQKYGEEVLPISIFAEEFDVIRAALEVHKGRDTRNSALLDQWYVRDDNNIPPVYVLKQTDEQLFEDCTKDDSSGTMSKEVIAAQQKELRHLLKRGAELAYLNGIIDSDTKYKYQTSELEQEVQHGIEHCDNPHRRCVLILRDIADLDNYLADERTPVFTDVVYNSRTERVEVEPEASELLQRLRKRATGLISPRNTLVHDVLWRFEEVISPQLHKTYIDKLCNQVEEVLKRLIDEDALEHPTEAELMPVATEALLHWSRCKMAATDSCCHKELRETMCVYVTGYSDRPLVVHGQAGSGKTTLVSNFALEVPDLVGNNCLCLLRYIGLTRESSNVRDLLHSLCTQITTALGCLPDDIPSDTNDLQRFFPKLLAAVPVDLTVVVILDAIDKILPDYDAHLMKWLPVHLPSHVKIIVTTLPNRHNIYHRLREEVLTGSNWFLPVGPLTPDAAQMLLQRFLLYFGRTLTNEQMLTVARMIQNDSSPLRIRLLSEELKTVTSSMDTATFCFPNTCSEAIERVFDRLEARFGRLLVARSMAYSVASVTGLCDCEMEDLLSLDDGVLNEVYISHHPSVRRIPYLTWHQIRNEIQSFLFPRERDGVTVSAWEHSRFVDVIEARYLTSPEDIQHVHSVLADYFLGAWADRPKPVEATDSMPKGLDGIEEDRRVPRQPLTFRESGDGQETRFNMRKFEQLPRHLDLSGRHEDLDRLVLFNYDWLYQKIKAFSLHHVLADFRLNPCDEANLVQQALQMAAPTIKCNADNLPAELSGRLLHYYTTHPNIRSLINQCDTCGLKQCCLLPNFAYQQVPGSALQYTLHCPVACDFLGFVFDERYLLGKKKDDSIVYVFDLLNGQLKDTVFTSNGELHVTPDGQHLVIVDHVTEKSIKIHESGTGNFVSQVIILNYLKVKAEGVYHAGPLSLSNDRMCAIVTTDTSFLCIANVPTGEVLEIAVLDGRATVCQITPDGRYVFCNSNEFLLSYDLYNLQHMATVPVGYRPTCLVFTADSQRAFLAGPTEGKLLVVHTHGGVVEMCYKSVLQDALADDPIRALDVSPDDNYVVIRCDYHVLVYHKVEERLKANFSKPVEVPEEFRLPNSGYRELIFTSAAFTRDSQGVIAALFRKIYIWDIGTSNLRVVIKTPIGIITKLLVSMRRNQLITHVTNATDVHVWNVDAALRQLPVLDRLTDAVQELQVTRRDTMVFVKCQNSDEVGVIDMRTGTLLDLLTHETKVRDFAVTPNGERALVCTVPRLSGTATKLWDVPARRIILEFGDSAGWCVSAHTINAILYISQSQPSFEAAYDITVYHFYGEQFTIRENPGACRFLRVKPQLTYDDRYLVLSSALGFDSHTGLFRSPCVVVFDVADSMRRSCYDATSVGLEDVMDDVVAVQPCAQRESLVVVIISLRLSLDPSVATMPNGETRSTSSSDSSSRPQSAMSSFQQFGFFILDVSTGTITAMCLDLPPQPRTGPTLSPSLIFSSDFQLCLDGNAFLFEIDQGCVFRGQLPLPGVPKAFALGGAMVVYVADEHQLVVVRVQDGCVLGRCEVHARICLLRLCSDERTLLVGCADGTLTSYVIVDPLVGGGVRSSQGSLERVAHRDVVRDEEQKVILSRSWDKVEIKSYPAYSRPPSALRPGSNDKEILQQIQPVPRVRPRSDSLLYLRKSQIVSFTLRNTRRAARLRPEDHGGAGGDKGASQQ